MEIRPSIPESVRLAATCALVRVVRRGVSKKKGVTVTECCLLLLEVVVAGVVIVYNSSK